MQAMMDFEPNGDDMDGVLGEQLLSFESSDRSGVFGEPEIPPRTGNQYQVEIPPLQGDCISYTKKSIADQENWEFMVGLPIPLMWVNPGVRSNITAKIESSNTIVDNNVTLGEPANSSSEKKLHEMMGPDCCLVPGTVLDSWTDIERASFLLGLYIFEKNFFHVKRFVETKNVGDILSFYYGEFYGSHEYRRWSECRKVRSRRSVYGPKMFTGLRQQELLSRLLSRIPEEKQKPLMEVSKAFGEGKILLEEYVFSLKALSGVSMLIEAVGIGKGGKYDLTCMAVEPSRSNHAMRSEVPVGKACSSLTTCEIIKFLTGDYRLSKARSNDIFWEAVWPRLLARGWHSEQPKNLNYAANPKHALVFLMPGVKKFSRKLVKGNHYFDSVTDVLGKVASDPTLLELDSQDEGIKSKESRDWTDEAKLEQDDLPTKRPCYLQPRTPTRSTDCLMFTVVDTSLSDGKPYKVRDLTSLSVDISNKLSSGNHAEESEEELSTDELDSVDTSVLNEADTTNLNRISSNGEMHSDEIGFEIGVSGQKFQEGSNEGTIPSYPASTTVPVIDLKSTKNIYEDKKPRKVVKAPSNKRLKENNVDLVAPVAKRRRRLTACSREETNREVVVSLMAPELEKTMRRRTSSSNDLSQNNIPLIGWSEDKVLSSSSSRSSPCQSVECAAAADHHGLKPPEADPQTRTMIDLNEPPQVLPDSEYEILMPALTDDHMKKPDDDVPGELKASTHMEQQQPSLDSSRRHGTRNRPPTARVLEALANGFLTVNTRRQKREGGSRRNTSSRSSRQTPDATRVTDLSNSTDVVSQMEEGEGPISAGFDINLLGKIQQN